MRCKISRLETLIIKLEFLRKSSYVKILFVFLYTIIKKPTNEISTTDTLIYFLTAVRIAVSLIGCTILSSLLVLWSCCRKLKEAVGICLIKAGLGEVALGRLQLLTNDR